MVSCGPISMPWWMKELQILVMCIGFQASGGAGFAGDALRSPWGGLRRWQWDDGEPRAVRTRAGQGYIGICFWLQWIFVSGRADVHGDLAAQRRYTVYYTNLYYLFFFEILGPRMGRGTCINKPVKRDERGFSLCSIAISDFRGLERKSNEGQQKAFGFCNFTISEGNRSDWSDIESVQFTGWLQVMWPIFLWCWKNCIC